MRSPFNDNIWLDDDTYQLVIRKLLDQLHAHKKIAHALWDLKSGPSSENNTREFTLTRTAHKAPQSKKTDTTEIIVREKKLPNGKIKRTITAEEGKLSLAERFAIKAELSFAACKAHHDKQKTDIKDIELGVELSDLPESGRQAAKLKSENSQTTPLDENVNTIISAYLEAGYDYVSYNGMTFNAWDNSIRERKTKQAEHKPEEPKVLTADAASQVSPQNDSGEGAHSKQDKSSPAAVQADSTEKTKSTTSTELLEARHQLQLLEQQSAHQEERHEQELRHQHKCFQTEIRAERTHAHTAGLQEGMAQAHAQKEHDIQRLLAEHRAQRDQFQSMHDAQIGKLQGLIDTLSRSHQETLDHLTADRKEMLGQFTQECAAFQSSMRELVAELKSDRDALAQHFSESLAAHQIQTTKTLTTFAEQHKAQLDAQTEQQRQQLDAQSEQFKSQLEQIDRLTQLVDRLLAEFPRQSQEQQADFFAKFEALSQKMRGQSTAETQAMFQQMLGVLERQSQQAADERAATFKMIQADHREFLQERKDTLGHMHSQHSETLDAMRFSHDLTMGELREMMALVLQMQRHKSEEAQPASATPPVAHHDTHNDYRRYTDRRTYLFMPIVFLLTAAQQQARAAAGYEEQHDRAEPQRRDTATSGSQYDLPQGHDASVQTCKQDGSMPPPPETPSPEPSDSAGDDNEIPKTETLFATGSGCEGTTVASLERERTTALKSLFPKAENMGIVFRTKENQTTLKTCIDTAWDEVVKTNNATKQSSSTAPCSAPKGSPKQTKTMPHNPATNTMIDILRRLHPECLRTEKATKQNLYKWFSTDGVTLASKHNTRTSSRRKKGESGSRFFSRAAQSQEGFTPKKLQRAAGSQKVAQ